MTSLIFFVLITHFVKFFVEKL